MYSGEKRIYILEIIIVIIVVTISINLVQVYTFFNIGFSHIGG
jgi:hypothetical protein